MFSSKRSETNDEGSAEDPAWDVVTNYADVGAGDCSAQCSRVVLVNCARTLKDSRNHNIASILLHLWRLMLLLHHRWHCWRLEWHGRWRHVVPVVLALLLLL